MDTPTFDALAQWGLGAAVALSLAAAMVKAFFHILAENRAMRRDLIQRHQEWEERFFLGLIDCINRNTTAVEKMQSSLEVVYRVLEETREENDE